MLLLTAQAFFLGLALAWITIPANTIFLQTFGSGMLPVTYVVAAIVGTASSALLAHALRRRSLSVVAVRLLVVVGVAIVASWLLLWRAGADWLSFGLVGVLPVALPVGFMFVVGQAGALLDVRVLKVLYPRVIAGFATGFAVGGLAGAPLLTLLGGTEHLLVVAALASGALLTLVLVTLRSFPTELSVVEAPAAGAGHVTLRALLTNRFIVLIMAFQMLSALESQWLDFLVYDRAATRYTHGQDLAQFVGRFSAIEYGADIAFLLLLAGLLMRRFGLRYGLNANPVVVLSMVVAVFVASVAQGSGAMLVFLVVVATRVADMTLSDGASRTSLSAVYQAVPASQRLAAQNNVESLAIPLAIGFSGVVILALRATIGTDGVALPALTSVVLLAWIGVAWSIYAHYRTNLLANLRHRQLEPADLVTDGASVLPVVDRLLASDDDRDVRLGLTALASIAPPDLADRLEAMAIEVRDELHPHVLGHLAETAPERAAIVARAGLDSPRPVVRAAGLTTLAAVGGRHDADFALRRLTDADPIVRVAAAAATSVLGDDEHRAVLGGVIEALTSSALADDRRLAAEMLASSVPGPWLDRALLRALLDDDDPSVRVAALDAFRWDEDEADEALLIDLLGQRATANAAVAVLARGGDRALNLMARCLDGSLPSSARTQILCARACHAMEDPGADELLQHHARHVDRDVGLAMIHALAHRVDGTADVEWASRLVSDQLDHAARLLRAIVVLDGTPAAAPLLAALDDEVRLMRRHVLATLSLIHGTEAMGRVEFQLAQSDTRVQALALEWLDVTLTGTDRRAIALLDPAASVIDQAKALGRALDLAPLDRAAVVRELAEDQRGVFRRPWLSACAILAIAHDPEPGIDLDELVLVSHDGPIDDIVQETLTAMAVRLELGHHG